MSSRPSSVPSGCTLKGFIVFTVRWKLILGFLLRHSRRVRCYTLRNNRFPEIPSWINRQRESVYRNLFQEHLDVLAWDTLAIEGRRLLTNEIRAELAEFGEEELLKKGFIIVARKPKVAA